VTSWARVPAVQPVDKDDLQDFIGTVVPGTLADITEMILDYLGLMPPVAPVEDEDEDIPF
jgi:hypothetical protein